MSDHAEGIILIEEEVLDTTCGWIITGVQFEIKASPKLQRRGVAQKDGLFAKSEIPGGYVLPYTGKLISATEYSSLPDSACDYVIEVLYFHDLPDAMRIELGLNVVIDIEANEIEYRDRFYIDGSQPVQPLSEQDAMLRVSILNKLCSEWGVADLLDNYCNQLFGVFPDTHSYPGVYC